MDSFHLFKMNYQQWKKNQKSRNMPQGSIWQSNNEGLRKHIKMLWYVWTTKNYAGKGFLCDNLWKRKLLDSEEIEDRKSIDAWNLVLRNSPQNTTKGTNKWIKEHIKSEFSLKSKWLGWNDHNLDTLWEDLTLSKSLWCGQRWRKEGNKTTSGKVDGLNYSDNWCPSRRPEGQDGNIISWRKSMRSLRVWHQYDGTETVNNQVLKLCHKHI